MAYCDRCAELEREVLLLREGKALAMRERDEARAELDPLWELQHIALLYGRCANPADCPLNEREALLEIARKYAAKVDAARHVTENVPPDVMQAKLACERCGKVFCQC